MTRAFLDGAMFINVAFVPGLAVGVSASIHRIGQDVMECGIGRRNPADWAGETAGRGLQRKRQSFGTKPEPDSARRAEFGEAFEDGADRAGDCFVGMKENFAILFSPDEAHGQAAPQFSASRLV